MLGLKHDDMGVRDAVIYVLESDHVGIETIETVLILAVIVGVRIGPCWD